METQSHYTALKFFFPIMPYTITQPFGVNAADYQQFGYPGHNGLDLWTSNVPPWVFPICKSVVCTAGWDAYGYGKLIVCRAAGYEFYYAHLASVHCKPGDLVEPTVPIGVMGSTGNSTGPHLHLGIRRSVHSGPFKGFVDPLPFLSESSAVTYDPADLDYDALLPPPPKPANPHTAVKTTKNKTVFRKCKRYF
jgi:murein DD-endopeptidase MepM/ murein hydrolase activator NlpD